MIRYGSRTTNTNTNKRNACSSRSYSRNFLFVSNCSRTFTNVTHKPLHIACDQLHLCVTFVHELFVNKKSLFEFVRVRVRLEFANLFGSGAMSGSAATRHLSICRSFDDVVLGTA